MSAIWLSREADLAPVVVELPYFGWVTTEGFWCGQAQGVMLTPEATGVSESRDW